MGTNLTYQQKIGTAYEYYILDHIKKNYEQAWHWKDVPEKYLHKLGIIKNYEDYSKSRKDIGVDLVALTGDQFYFIQCKNYSRTIRMEAFAGFFVFLHEFNLSGVIYYSGKLSINVRNALCRTPHINIPFNNMNVEKKIIASDPPIFKPRDYQLDAYKKLKGKKNTILSLPCGMGKTFIAALLAKKYTNIIILSPLRLLAYQTLQHFMQYLGDSYSPILISTDGCHDTDTVRKIMGNKNILSSTYHSVNIVLELLDELEDVFIVVDEFHNLSCNNINKKTNNIHKIIHSNNNKIFLSATPIQNFMNVNEKNIYKYSWKDAIEKKYICDFEIYLPSNDINMQKFAYLIKETCNFNIDDALLMKTYFGLKNMLYNGNKKTIFYVTSVEKADKMCDMLLWTRKLLNIDVDYYQLSYKTKKTIREKIIKKFKETDKRIILINVHILDEGIDIPECDSVYITKPNDNISNIIQRICRANRITETKNKCYIYLWCGKNKTKKIIKYIYKNTDTFFKQKIFFYNESVGNTYKYNPTNNNIILNHFISYGGEKIITIIDDVGKIWFCANDIATIIGYKDISRPVRKLVDKNNKKFFSELESYFNKKNMHIPQNKLFVNVSGFSSLIACSKMKNAIAFQKYLVDKLLSNHMCN